MDQVQEQLSAANTKLEEKEKALQTVSWIFKWEKHINANYNRLIDKQSMKKNEFNLFEKQQVLELKKLSSNSFHTMCVCIAPFSPHLESRIQGKNWCQEKVFFDFSVS